MINNYKIELIAKDKMESILPLISSLNKGRIPVPVLEERLKDMLLRDYECLGVYDQDELIGICGIWVLSKFYVGKHLEPDNVFVKETYRSKGIGNLMMDWVLNYAKELDCESTEINVYVKNRKGKQFWENQGYKVVGFHMQQYFRIEK